MEKNAATGRTLSSVPMSMPPPVALNLYSPNYIPLSPLLVVIKLNSTKHCIE
ncbi:hypothetical protein MKX03_030281, partial [Papaver bracteatum]